MRVLLIEDDADHLFLQSKELRVAGCVVLTAPSAEDGLYIAQQEHPDLVVSDIAFPGGMDGFELARKFKEAPELKPIPIVALTGDTLIDGTKALEAGFDEVFIKPLDAKRLTESVLSVLKGEQRNRLLFRMDMIRRVDLLAKQLHETRSEAAKRQEFIDKRLAVIESEQEVAKDERYEVLKIVQTMQTDLRVGVYNLMRRIVWFGGGAIGAVIFGMFLIYLRLPWPS